MEFCIVLNDSNYQPCSQSTGDQIHASFRANFRNYEKTPEKSQDYHFTQRARLVDLNIARV